MKSESGSSIRDLGNGLVLRSATHGEGYSLAQFAVRAFANPDTGEPDHFLGGWVRDLMRGRHPTFCPSDFIVVEDTRSGAIVSCSCLISQEWKYDGIPFRVGRVEIVATDPAYRRRGLVREQFRVLHEWSAARGESVQAITGIPYYYRQYGYEYALSLVGGKQLYAPQQIPAREKGHVEKFKLRRAQRKDLAFISRLIEQNDQRSLVNCVRDTAILAYEQFGERDPFNGHKIGWLVLETLRGERVGALAHRSKLFGGRLDCFYYELTPRVTWTDVTPSVLRGLSVIARNLKSIDQKPFGAIGWFLIDNHPLFDLIRGPLPPIFQPYAWYLRVQDIPSFLMHIAPSLERRLAASHVAGYSGTVKLNFFRDGMELTLRNGKLVSGRPWSATAGDFGQSGFGNATIPGLEFLKLLFGYRSLQEIRDMFPDSLIDNEDTRTLLEVLFPKQPSFVLPIH